MGNDGKRSGFLGGFVLGSIVGVVIAFFLSQKGDRDTIRSKIGEVISRGKETVREAIEEGKEAAAQKEAEFQAKLDKDEE